MANSSLPEYSVLPSSPTEYFSQDGPSTTIPQLLTHHKYRLYKTSSVSNVCWATLTVLSRARSSMDPPCFVESDAISGTVEIDAEKENIQAVDISVKGRLIIDTLKPGDYVDVFLNLQQLLWSKHLGKLSGKHTWPFSISLPLEIKIQSKLTSTRRLFNLPRSFPKAYGVEVQYDILVHFARGPFKKDCRIETAFSYDPLSPPDPPSMLRQFAYQDNSPLVGPGRDREGWTSLTPMNIRGTIFDNIFVDAKCTLHLARPLFYTRGSVIPCILTLESESSSTLDILASPIAFPVRLLRLIVASPKPSLPPEDVIEHVESAVWWVSAAGEGGDPCKRRLDGEIRLNEKLLPSTAIASFAVIYSVVLFPFEAFAFKATKKEPWVSKAVEITTTYAEGPRPIPSIPPGYDTLRKPSIVDYHVPLSVFV